MPRSIVQIASGAWGLMPDAAKSRLTLIAGACLIAGMLLVIGIPADTWNFEFGGLASAPRFFLAGVLVGTGTFLITFSKWMRIK